MMSFFVIQHVFNFSYVGRVSQMIIIPSKAHAGAGPSNAALNSCSHNWEIQAQRRFDWMEILWVHSTARTLLSTT